MICACARLSQRKTVSPHKWSSGIEDPRSRRCCYCEMPLPVKCTANGFRKLLWGSISKLACRPVSSFHAQGGDLLAVPLTDGTLTSTPALSIPHWSEEPTALRCLASCTMASSYPTFHFPATRNGPSCSIACSISPPLVMLSTLGGRRVSIVQCSKELRGGRT